MCSSDLWTSVTSARVSVDTWYNNKKGTFAFGADGTGFWGITRGYGADTAKPNADISKSYSVSPSAKPDVPSAAQQPGSTASDKKPTITVSGEVSPSGTLTLGKNFGLRGTISTDCGKITLCRGYILEVVDGDTAIRQRCEYTPNDASVDIRTTINNNLIFENLPAGSYKYYVLVVAENGSESTTYYFSRPFTVS